MSKTVITFDSELVVNLLGSNENTTAYLESGPVGSIGPEGPVGLTGPRGITGLMVEDAGEYPAARPEGSTNLVFVGPDVPGTVPGASMVDGDVYVNNAEPVAATPNYVTEASLDAWLAAGISGNVNPIMVRSKTIATWYAENPVLAQGEWGLDTTNRTIRMGDGVTAYMSLPSMYLTQNNNDLVQSCPSDMRPLDEFDAPTLDPVWVRVDFAGGADRTTWTQKGGVLSCGTSVNNAADSTAEWHALMRPLNLAIGGPMSTGDAFVTRLTMFGPYWTNYTMGGIVLADGITHGAGAQLIARSFLNTSNQSNDLNTCNNYGTDSGSGGGMTSVPQTPLWVRVVLTGTNTWRVDYSRDGVTWAKNIPVTRALTPTHVGFGCSSWNTSTKGGVTYDFLRRMSGVT